MNTANNGRGINLYLDPWLPVVDLKAGTTKEISLQDAMMNAKGYMLAAQTRVEKVSLLRTLCALAGTVLYRYDASGKEAYVKDADEAVKRWAEAFKKGFSENAVKAYGKKWEDYLYLHDEKYPFYQTPDLDRGKKKIPRTAKGAIDTKKIYSISKINPAVYQSNNSTIQMSIVQKKKTDLTEPELARALIAALAFIDNSAKELGGASSGTSWPGHRVTVYAEGKNLLETMLLNIPMTDRFGELWDSMTPNWERSDRPTEPTLSDTVPRDPANIMTAQARRIELFKEFDYKMGYSRGGDIYDTNKGKDKLPMKEPMNDPMISCREDAESHEPVPNCELRETTAWAQTIKDFLKKQDMRKPAGKEDGERQNTGITAGLFEWLDTVDDIGADIKDVTLQFTLITYKGLTRSGFDTINGTSSKLRIDIKDEDWKDLILEELAKLDDTADALRVFGRKIAGAASYSNPYWARDEFYTRCKSPFESFMNAIDIKKTDKEKIKAAWEKKALSVADECMHEMIDRIGLTNFIAREVKDGSKKTPYTPGEIYSTKKRIEKILDGRFNNDEHTDKQ